MSLTTAGIHCTIRLSQGLSGAMEDCSTVRVQQPRTLCRRRCCPRHDACSAGCGMQPPLTSIDDKTAVVGQVRWRNARHRLVDERGHADVCNSDVQNRQHYTYWPTYQQIMKDLLASLIDCTKIHNPQTLSCVSSKSHDIANAARQSVVGPRSSATC